MAAGSGFWGTVRVCAQRIILEPPVDWREATIKPPFNTIKRIPPTTQQRPDGQLASTLGFGSYKFQLFYLKQEGLVVFVEA
ncbi:hypothetical protein CEXT_12251 [Caerostris extrusa]|uniref:Uncharacterized protein n=1 Tax=Caerostris extrusa TaxID=172846 RepID=A0AAV4SJN4_CAEEX|nr:hypothetical protein CEXT_12251 [Caerostris extrusa]